jgi:hypothetical protein
LDPSGSLADLPIVEVMPRRKPGAALPVYLSFYGPLSGGRNGKGYRPVCRSVWRRFGKVDGKGWT